MTLIRAEDDLTQPRHIELTRMINELSVTGFPLLVETARVILERDRVKSQTFEEDHLLDQLRALMIDLDLVYSSDALI